MEKILTLLKEIVSFLKIYGVDGVYWIIVLAYVAGVVYPDWANEIMSASNIIVLGIIYLGVKLFNSQHVKSETFHEEYNERFNANVNVKTELLKLKYETRADRAYIMEYHNGKTNGGSGLNFLFVDMTYEETGTLPKFVNQECQDMNTSIFNFPDYVAQNYWFIGDTKKLAEIDLKIAHRMEDNDVRYCANILLKNQNSIVGILGVSYETDKPEIDDEKILQIMSLYAQSIGNYLNPKGNVKKKKSK